MSKIKLIIFALVLLAGAQITIFSIQLHQAYRDGLITLVKEVKKEKLKEIESIR